LWQLLKINLPNKNACNCNRKQLEKFILSAAIEKTQATRIAEKQLPLLRLIERSMMIEDVEKQCSSFSFSMATGPKLKKYCEPSASITQTHSIENVSL